VCGGENRIPTIHKLSQKLRQVSREFWRPTPRSANRPKFMFRPHHHTSLILWRMFILFFKHVLSFVVRVYMAHVNTRVRMLGTRGPQSRARACGRAAHVSREGLLDSSRGRSRATRHRRCLLGRHRQVGGGGEAVFRPFSRKWQSYEHWVALAGNILFCSILLMNVYFCIVLLPPSQLCVCEGLWSKS
jgi:hypothetical protein